VLNSYATTVPCDWVVTQGLLQGRFRLCRLTSTRRESWCSRISRSRIRRRRSVLHSSALWTIFHLVSFSFSDVDVRHPTCPVGSCIIVALAVVLDRTTATHLRLCGWVMTWMRLRYNKQLCPMTWTRYKSLSSRASRSHLSDTCSVVNIRFPLRCLTCEAIVQRVLFKVVGCVRRHVMIVAGIMGSHQRCRLSLLTLRYPKP
jgi:hypothetical protein